MKSSTWIPTLIGLALMTSATSSVSSAAELEAGLERHRISEGESVELTLRLRGGSSGDAPDLRPLQEDFEVLDVGRSLRTTLVNGHRDSSFDWHITLLPRRTGSLEVPALRVGGETSSPLPIEISERQNSPVDPVASNSRQPVFVEAEVDSQSPYVQGGVTLTVRLHADDQVIDGALTEPSAADAIIERVGEDQTYRTRVGEREYSVIERRWAIFPQQSGRLDISPVRFEGTVRTPGQPTRRDPFDNFFGNSPFDDFFGGSPLGGSLFDRAFGPAGQRVRVSSQSISLDVRPKPDEALGQWWVPATDVELVEQWEETPPVFRVGEPINRLVAIRAAGISVSQLPELELPPVDGLKQYSEPAVEQTVAIGDEVVAVKARQTSLIPTRPGPLTLPAVELEWWDTTADAPRTATLPERTLHVTGGGSLAAIPPAPPAAGPSAPVPGPMEPEAAVSIPSALDSPLTWGGAALVGLCLAGGTAWALARRRSQPTAPTETAFGQGTPAVAPAPRLARAEQALRRACMANNSEGALGALSQIGQARWPESPPLNAGDWTRRIQGAVFAEAFEVLQRVRYSPETGHWNGAELWQAYSESRRSSRRSDPRRKRTRGGPLPALYPEGSTQ
ncbi:BatD family protein [Myxococcota bacterium]|nr:BatD family protein [Myxococcota bacterium]